jgi:16S rRNA (uracil1498-N3)-methyltransferase
MRPRAPVPGLASGDTRLDASVSRYLSRVLRLRAGDTFVAFDPATGREADVLVRGVNAGAVSVTFGPAREPEARSASVRVTWVQGLPKATKCDAIVRDATELGVARIVIAATRRAVVKLDAARAQARQGRWTRIAWEAARQCGRSEAPAVEAPLPWHEALDLAANAEARFCLWERAEEPLSPALSDALSRARSIAFACGPEGGLEDDEAQAALERGWTLASLGPLILRTETVAAAVLGAVRIWGP